MKQNSSAFLRKFSVRTKKIIKLINVNITFRRNPTLAICTQEKYKYIEIWLITNTLLYKYKLIEASEHDLFEFHFSFQCCWFKCCFILTSIHKMMHFLHSPNNNKLYLLESPDFFETTNWIRMKNQIKSCCCFRYCPLHHCKMVG